jgi:pyrroline-5-carboxylate reductase
MSTGKKVGIIGGGKMGGVLIQGMITRNIRAAEDIIVADIDRARLAVLRETYGIAVTEDSREVVKKGHILILAVKPQNMAEALDHVSRNVTVQKLVISIAAGIPIRFMEERLKKGVPIIRTMPNTPALVGVGMTALAAGRTVSEDDMTVARQIFDAVGRTVVVKEELIDAVTGLSGSGPAYAFIMIEALADGGVQMGLSRDVAVTLAAQTLLGASRLVLEGDKHTAQLKDMVTSPGGTTIAGLRALEEGKLRATLMAAVEAATLRSKALGGQS